MSPAVARLDRIARWRLASAWTTVILAAIGGIAGAVVGLAGDAVPTILFLSGVAVAAAAHGLCRLPDPAVAGRAARRMFLALAATAAVPMAARAWLHAMADADVDPAPIVVAAEACLWTMLAWRAAAVVPAWSTARRHGGIGPWATGMAVGMPALQAVFAGVVLAMDDPVARTAITLIVILGILCIWPIGAAAAAAWSGMDDHRWCRPPRWPGDDRSPLVDAALFRLLVGLPDRRAAELADAIHDPDRRAATETAVVAGCRRLRAAGLSGHAAIDPGCLGDRLMLRAIAALHVGDPVEARC